MERLFGRLKVLFLILFAIISAGLWAHAVFYVWPAKACEAKGDWWDNKARVCAVPMPLTHWTGRPLSGAKPTPSKP